MKVLLYADFRSPHALGWRAGLKAAGIDVLAISSEAVDVDEIISPSGSISRIRQSYVADSVAKTSRSRTLRGWLASQQLTHSAVQVIRARSRRRDLTNAVTTFQPDLVHALRLPYEGITALSTIARTSPVPIVVSSWGQDFEPQASSDPLLRFWLSRHLRHAAGFQFDSTSDLARARRYGLRPSVPTLHAAGNFGVDESLFHSADPKVDGLVVYARKAVPSCNYLGFIEASLDLMKTTTATFVGVGLEHLIPEVVERYGEFDRDRLRLVGQLPGNDFAALLRSAQVIVSPSYSDGMPVTVLGAVASGSRIVAGRLPQLEELVDQGADIVLVDAHETSEIAAGIAAQLGSGVSVSATLPEQYSRSANALRVPDFYAQVLAATDR